MNPEAEIGSFILEELLSGTRQTLNPEEPLTGSNGPLDSLGIVRLFTFLEERIGIKIGDGDVGEENFGTLRRVAAFVDRKRMEPQPPIA